MRLMMKSWIGMKNAYNWLCLTWSGGIVECAALIDKARSGNPQ